MVVAIASLSRDGRNVIPTVLKAIESLHLENSHYSLSSPSRHLETDNFQKLAEANFCSPIVVAWALPKHLKHLFPHVSQLGSTTTLFEGTLYSNFSSKLNSPSPDGNMFLQNEMAFENLLGKSDGDFAAITIKPGLVLAVRDSVGVQPLYYGENANLKALATNRSALWKLGVTNPSSFPPGRLVSMTQNVFEFKPVKSLTYSEPKRIALNDGARYLQELLVQSIRLRLRDVKELAVAFSGGLDSSVIAFLTRRCGASVRLVHVSLCGQAETHRAKKTAEELKLPLSVHLFDSSDVEKTVPKVIRLIEEPDPVKVAIGIPFYWVAQETALAGLNVLFAGQGADELFGGYQRYVTEYLSHGENPVRKVMFNDVVKLPASNLERDKKICGFHGVDLRLPFASFGLLEFAMSLPINLKFERKTDGLRKLVLRRLARNLGLSDNVVSQPKKAVQYSTGVNAMMKKIAAKRGLIVSEYVRSIFEREKVDG